MYQQPQSNIPAFETTSLISKFKSLWLAGVEANLVFETRAGQAWGTLHVNLGEHPGQAQPPLYHQERPHQKHDSPAKQRRRERRKAARSETAIETVDMVAEEATNSIDEETNENSNINSATEEVQDSSDKVVTEEEATSGKVSESVEKLKERNDDLNKDIKICDDSIEQLKEKVKNLEEENLELKNKIMVTTMFYDMFKDEMKDRFGYDSDEEAEQNWQEILKKEQLEKDKLSCDKCVFVSKSEAGLKIHEGKKHKEEIRS